MSAFGRVLQSFRSSEFRTGLLAIGTLLHGVGCQTMPQLHSHPDPVRTGIAETGTAGDASRLFAVPDFDESFESAGAGVTGSAGAVVVSPSPQSAPAPIGLSGVLPESGAEAVDNVARMATAAEAQDVAKIQPAPVLQPTPIDGNTAVRSPEGGSRTEVVTVADKPVTVVADAVNARSENLADQGKATESNAAGSVAAGGPAAASAAAAAVASAAAGVGSGVQPTRPAAVQETVSPVQRESAVPLPQEKKSGAAAALPAFSERRPEPFSWRRTGRSAGGRPFEIALTGEKGFRTLFVGSAVGNDPMSLQLMERLAVHLHENSLILGGFEVGIIRTLNPDGAASGTSSNALGRYINGRFPLRPDQQVAEGAPEVTFLLGCIRSFRPQRIVHVRTIAAASGVIAANQRCAETAEAIAGMLKFSRLTCPAQSREGSLEFCLASQPDLDVITLAIPRAAAQESDPWELYGDTLLNLLQPQSAAGREASRESVRGQGAVQSP